MNRSKVVDEGNQKGWKKRGIHDIRCWPLEVFDHIWQHFVVERLAPLLVESVAAGETELHMDDHGILLVGRSLF